MSRAVLFDPRVYQQLESAYLWWAEHRNQLQAARWFNGFVKNLGRLGDNPQRFSLAAEDEYFPYEVRQLLYGLGSKPSHRALFTINSKSVYVFTIRHVAQAPVTPDTL